MGEKLYYILKVNPLLKGFARIVNIDGVLSEDYKHIFGDKNDSECIFDDWKMVGEDIKKAFKEYEQETTSSSTS